MEIQALLDATETGQWTVICAAAITLLVSQLKRPLLGGLVKKHVPRRWRAAVPILLGGAAAVLLAVSGGVSWQEAVYVGLFSGPGAVFCHEVVVHAILGRERGSDG